ncbi:hypothetical protein DEU32_1017 [Curtobacterium sp. AG1037]|uniref:hypothetical protein n=1 Tax=Curtobacterium sp. AG1037 TaxID=2183990 RepID=UPI000E0AAD61|nr:hypothetical protein [Curtobacterium sp. AG1037]RDI02104.1 hypothetical protein DEU32_1017 [Curtobacterium sp. AG1037]
MFQDSKPVIAADVVWSLQQVKDNASFVDSAQPANITSIASPSSDQIVLTLDFEAVAVMMPPPGYAPRGRA